MNLIMEDMDERLLEIICPCCRSRLWIDVQNREVIRSERPGKQKASLDELLLKEKQKKEGADGKFLSTAELARRRKAEAQDKFARAFGKADEEG
jgi:uncharacterized protein YbaR (Trm112 family)